MLKKALIQMFKKHNFIMLYTVAVIFMLQLNATGNAVNASNINATETNRSSSSSTTQNATAARKNNTFIVPKEHELEQETQQRLKQQSAKAAAAIRHIPRQRRELDVTDAYSFEVAHAPCDLDNPWISERVINLLPSYCVNAYNIRYSYETAYRNWRLYQTEGWFFGQYFVRLNRYESEPHIFEYGDTGLQ